MEVRFALKRQYHAGLAQLKECVERASEETWLSGTQAPGSGWSPADEEDT